jgi:branched-chain amino acid transport system ATP-binding protein
VLHQGKVLADGAPETIRENARVREIYLGDADVAPAAVAAPAAGEKVLEVEHLDSGYDLSHVLHEVTFAIARGEIVALLGRNGVGKTTTLRSIAGLTQPWRGSHVRLNGIEIAGQAPERIAALGVSYVPDDRRIFPDLTAAENLRVPALALRRTRWTREKIAEIFPPLAALWERKGRHLSGGEQKMLAIGRALMTDPALLLLDEPSEGLGPLIVRILVEALARIRGEGVTVLIADQNLMFARATADRALVMERGRLVHAAARSELLGDQSTLQRLLAV